MHLYKKNIYTCENNETLIIVGFLIKRTFRLIISKFYILSKSILDYGLKKNKSILNTLHSSKFIIKLINSHIFTFYDFVSR